MRTRKRFLSLLLCGAMLFSLCTPSVYAEAQTTQDSGQITADAGGLCEHHIEHTVDCGYTEGELGTPCTHEHTEDCYTQVTKCVHEHTAECYSEEAADSVSGSSAPTSDTEERELENCGHVCSEESGCITEELDCEHEHGEDCGYTPATEGTLCTYVCERCRQEESGEIKPPAPSNGEKTVTVADVQSKIDELPEAVTEDNSEEVRRLLDEILAIYGELSEEEQEKVDLTRCMELQAALNPANLPMTATDTLRIGDHPLTQTDDDVLDDGTVSYNADTNTIILNNYNPTNGKIYYNSSSDRQLTVELRNKNSLQSIYVQNACLKIMGPGSLTINSEEKTENCITLADGDLVIDSAEVMLTSTGETGCGIHSAYTYSRCSLTISRSTVTVKSKYTGLNIGKNITIEDNSVVNFSSSTSDGIAAYHGAVEISNSTVTGVGYRHGICSTDSNIKIDNSKVEAESTYEFDGSDRFPGMYGKADVIIINCTGDKEVTAISASSCGIWSGEGLIEIDDSKVTAQGYYPGLNGKNGVVIQSGSDVTATSSGSNGIYSPATIEINGSKVTAEGPLPGVCGDQGVSIQNGSDVIATSSNDCGIFSLAKIEIDSSKVTAEGLYAGLQGNQGVTITDCTGDHEVKATSDSAAGIFSPATIEINSSKVTAEGLYAGLQGNQGVTITNCTGENEVKATSDLAAGICIQSDDASIAISNSKVTATGYYTGLQTEPETTGYISITDGSKVTATATIDIDDGYGVGISTIGDLTVEDSEVYAEGRWQGIYIENEGTASNSWIRAENDLVTAPNTGSYKPTDSVTVHTNKWWVAGNAKIPEDVLVKAGDEINIPTNASLTIGETGKTIKGEARGISVDDNGELLLKSGTIIIDSKDGNKEIIIGKDGGKITLDGEVSGAAVYAITVQIEGVGTASASQISAEQGTEISLSVTEGNDWHFKGWQVISGDVIIIDNKFTMPAENVIVKAIFEKDTYPVTLISNGGTINSGNVTEYTYGVGATLPTDVSKESYAFAGWYQNSDCSGSPVTEISKTDTGNKMFYAKWVSTDAGVTEVSVDKTAGTISGSTITVVLPYGTAPLPTETGEVSIIPADGATVSNLQLAESDGSKWTFTVTAEDKTTTKDYIIKVSIAPDPAAENKAAIAAAKSTIEARNWTVEQTTANTNEEVKAWIENQLKGMNLNDVVCTVSITGFIAATAGSSTDADGTDGSFTFTVSLSKGENSTLAQGITEEITGKITAAAYQAKSYTVSVSASPTAGGTVSGSGTFEENASVKVSAVAKDGYHFVKWTEGSSDVSTNADYTFIVTGDRTLVAVFEKDSDPTPPQQHTVTVQTNSNGTASASPTSATAGTKITLTATPNTDYHFKEWQVISGDVTISNNSFIMPAANVTVKAVFEKDSTPTKPTEYTVTVQAGTGGTASGSGTFEENASVTVTAAANSGYHFVRWTENRKEVSTSTRYTFIVTGDRTLVAVFEKDRSSSSDSEDSSYDDSSSDDDDSSSGVSVIVKRPDPVKPEIPTTGQTKPVILDTNGNAAVDNGAVQSAINAAKNDAKKNSSTARGVAVVIPITPKAGQNSFNVTIKAQTLNTLVREDVKRLEINIEGVLVGGMDASLLKWLDTVSANGDIILRVKRAAQSSLSKEAKDAIGTRPVYELSLVYLSSGKEIPITNFNGHTITVRLPYTLAKGEQAGNLYAVYVDEKGKVEWLTKSSYNPDLNAVIFETGHFSIYGIGYKNPAPVFTDIKNHWAEDNIIYVASRGLLTGTGNNQFSPNTSMTRGMFVTALGRLAGINQDSYKTGKFTDVKADAYYAPYVNWAAEKGIVNGTTTTTFSPDTNITREQMAVIMANYVKKLGYDLPAAHEAVTFVDNAQISGWAAKEVKAMQQAGIMAGKGGNRFDPKGTATRAEVATVLRRFVEIVIDPQTAQGWMQNHSGSWQYMKNGKPATGWKQIDGKWYYFYSDGSMAVNTVIDGRKIGPDGVETKQN